MIAQCFADLTVDTLPQISAADDAADAAWFSLDQIRQMCRDTVATPGVDCVIERAEELPKADLLRTTIFPSTTS